MTTYDGIGQGAYKNIVVKTSSYTIDPLTDPCGTIFSTRGATANVTFTLPAASDNKGLWYRFASVADVDLIVAGADEEVVALNDLTADNVQFTGTSLLIGGGFEMVCDGTSWLTFATLAGETQAVTVTSA